MVAQFLTPVVIFIIQTNDFFGSLNLLLLSCDCAKIFEVWYIWYIGEKSTVPLLTIVSLFPLFASIVSKLGNFNSVSVWFHLPRLICFCQVSDRLKSFSTSLIKVRFPVDESTFRILSSLMFGSMYASFMACIWFYLGYNNSTVVESSWVSFDSVIVLDSYFSRYIRSLHFVVTTTFTIGYGDISPSNDVEIVFSLILIFNALLFFAFSIAIMTSLLTSRNVTQKRFRAEMESLKRFLFLQHTPTAVRNIISAYFNFLYDRQYGMMEEKMFPALPAGILFDIKDRFTSQLKSVPFFSHQSDEFVSTCVRLLSFRAYPPGAIVFLQDERRRELMLVRSGRIEIFNQESKSALTTLVPGDHVGEFQLIFGTACELNARAAVFTEVAVLSYEAYSVAIEEAAAVAEEYYGCVVMAHKWIESRPNALVATVDAHKGFLSRFVTVQSSVEKTANNKRMLAMMREVSNLFSESFTIPPSHVFRLIWDVVIGFCCLYYVIVVPLRVMILYCQHSNHRHNLFGWDWSLIIDYLCDILFIVDFILRGGYFSFELFESDLKIMVTRKSEIWSHFIKTSRAFNDFILCLPFDLIALFTGNILLIRLIKAYSYVLLPVISREIIQFLDEVKHITISSEAVNIVQLSLNTLVVIVWSSVIWAVIHSSDEVHNVVSSFYWCLTTMTTVG